MIKLMFAGLFFLFFVKFSIGRQLLIKVRKLFIKLNFRNTSCEVLTILLKFVFVVFPLVPMALFLWLFFKTRSNTKTGNTRFCLFVYIRASNIIVLNVGPASELIVPEVFLVCPCYAVLLSLSRERLLGPGDHIAHSQQSS